MQFIIGLDGGGTKTKCTVASVDNQEVYTTTGAGTNFLALGMEAACSNIFSIIRECCDSLNISYSNISKILIGTAGAGRKADADKLEYSFKNFCGERKIQLPSLAVRSDAEIALEGAFSGKPGCILIAGTGSIIYGKDESGKVFRSGGFGRIIGDEGGGYSIGRKVLQAVSKSFDKRAGRTLLNQLLMQKYNISTAGDLIKAVYDTGMDVASNAELALLAAEKGDKAAVKILDEESDELILLLSAHLKKMKTRSANLCLLGSLLEHENYYSLMLKEKISGKFEYIELRKPEYPPQMGAVFLAQKSGSNS